MQARASCGVSSWLTGEARQAAIRIFRERFAAGWALLEEFDHENPVDET